jgi:hypothetical protein
MNKRVWRPPVEGDPDLVLSSIEQGLNVGLITTFDPLYCEADDEVSEVVNRSELQDFDYVPVMENGTVMGLLERTRADLPHFGPVRDAMMSLNGDLLISADAGIFSYIESAEQFPCRLVLSRSRVNGIVTLADLQKLPVRPTIFLLITHLELLMATWIRRRCPREQDWLDLLPQRRKGIDKQWRKLEQNNLAIDKLTATHFTDKYCLVLEIGSFESRDKCEDELYRVKELRNRVAHAGDFALTQDNAQETIAAVGFARKWIHALREGLDDGV